MLTLLLANAAGCLTCLGLIAWELRQAWRLTRGK